MMRLSIECVDIMEGWEAVIANYLQKLPKNSFNV